jgi:hypothetical protein
MEILVFDCDTWKGPKVRTVADVVKAQERHPVFLHNNIFDNALDDRPKLLRGVMKKLGVDFSWSKENEHPLTDAEFEIVGEGTEEVAEGIHVYTGYSVLYKGDKYMLPSMEFCFDSDNRPFSVDSYGGHFYPDPETAKADALKFAEALAEAAHEASEYVFVFLSIEPDAHYVSIPLLPADIFDAIDFDPEQKERSGEVFSRYLQFLGSVFAVEFQHAC